MLSAILTFADCAQEAIKTDESWLARKNGAYCAPCRFDGRIPPDAFVNAEVTENIWHTETAPIPVRSEEELRPAGSDVTLAPGEKKSVVLMLDMIDAGFVRVQAEAAGEVYAHIACRELEEEGSAEDAVFTVSGEYRGFTLHSAGNLLAALENRSAHAARVRISYIDTHYPVTEEAETTVSDEALNQLLRTCRHTLKICRQTHHLDGPGH